MSSGFVLVSRFPSFQPSRFALPEGITTVGRSSACDFVIRDETVSRQHAEIAIQGQTAKVRDLGSSNGTFVNGARISSSSLVHGQQLHFGQVGFLVCTAEEYDFDIDSTQDTSPPVKSLADGAAKTRIPDAFLFSPAQRRVLELLLGGSTEKAVAKSLGIARNTVHNHISDIYRICHVHSRPELLALFLRRNEDEGKSTH